MVGISTCAKCVLVGAASWLAVSLAAGGAWAQAAMAFDIAAQPLAKALVAFNKQSGVIVMAPAALVQGKAAPAVRGDMAPEAALDAILAGSGLVWQRTGSGAFTIVAAQAADDDAATRRAPPRQTASEATDLVMEQMVVTGTNIRGVINPTTPVVQIRREDIELSGAATVADLARLIPQNFSANTPVSTNSANPFDQVGANSAQGTAFDLRGLGAGSTLVLLNGRRLGNTGNSSFFDVSILPLSVIDRVDVLTDGASAIYGADAVGGVVNFITRHDFEGVELRGRYGTLGGADDYSVGATAGLNWTSGGIFVSGDYFESDRLELQERDFIDLEFENPLGGFETTNPEGTFLPERQDINVALSATQDVTRKLSAGVDFIYSRSDTTAVRSLFNNDTLESTVNSFFVLANLSYQISDNWNIDGFFDYGSNKTSTTFIDEDQGVETIDKNDLLVVEGRVSGSVLDLPGGSVESAFGFSYRKEEFKVPTGSSILLENPKRKVFAAYGELLIPLVGEANSVPIVRALDLSIAGRFEDYSDFGTTTNPKLGVRWSITDGLSLRGTYGRSFRAPSLIDSFRQPEIIVGAFPRSFFPNSDDIPQNPKAPDGTIVTIAGSQPGGVSEERATSWSGGVQYSPDIFPSLNIEVNYFSVSYKDRVRIISLGEVLLFSEFNDLLIYNPDVSDVESILSIQNAFISDGALTFDAVPEDFQALSPSGLINLSEIDVDGLDFSVSYDMETDFGSFNAVVNASYMLSFRTRATPTSQTIDTVGLIFRPAELVLRASLSWSNGPLTLFSSLNRTSGSVNDQISPQENVGAFTTVDLAASFDAGERYKSSWLRNLRITVNVVNLFNEDPPFANTLDALNFDAANANPLKRIIRLQLAKRF